MAVGKYRLLMRPDETLNGVSWGYFNIDKVPDPPTLLADYDLSSAIRNLSNDFFNFTSFKRSDTPPSDTTNTVRIDDNSEIPIYAWLSEELNTDIMYYTEADSILIKYSDTFSFSWSMSSIISVDIFDTSKANDLSSMFYQCSSLISLDVSNFDTSNVTNIRHMFGDCESLTSLNVSNFNTSKVINMSSMFSGCNNLTSLDVSNFDTSNVTDMSSMFGWCNSLTSLNVSNFDTSKVTRMYSMFDRCSSLTTLDLSNFNTSNVTTMERMFAGCSLLTSLDLSTFDTSKVTNMREMFSTCQELISLDISNFNVSNVASADTYNMFDDCIKLNTIICTEEIEQWIRDNSSRMGITINNITFNRP